MSDLIDRQAAIDAAVYYGEFWMEYNNKMSKSEIAQRALLSAKAAMVGMLKELPAVETSRWILCSEQLPERHQTVLITIYGTDVIRMKQGESFEDALARVRKNVRVSVGYRSEERWYGADGYPQIVAPIAWMPLPEPWKGGGEDGNQTE